MRFTKMQGTGNDYVYVNCFDQPPPKAPAELARRISDRHFGVGSDGLILIRPSELADARMQMFNADGSEAEMCGNGLRCVAKYVYDHGLCRRGTLRIETGAGVRSVELETANGRVSRARIDMGQPILEPGKIPTTLPGRPSTRGPAVIDAPLEVSGLTPHRCRFDPDKKTVIDSPSDVAGPSQQLRVTCVSMGNPHAVVFVDRITDHMVLQVGPKLELDPHFPNRVNAEFVQVISPGEVRMRVWERGSGETLACGTGASAVCVAGAIGGRTGRKVLVHLVGGELELDWADDNHVYLTGPAVEVFSGEWSE